jgi:hypothetical protein
MVRAFSILSALALIGAAPAPPPASAPPPTPKLLSVKEVMRHIVNPAAELYWKAAGEETTEAGTIKHVPTAADDARWNATLDAAMVLQESGNLLLMDGRRIDDDQWAKRARQLVNAGVLAIEAAKARDEQQTFDAGSALYDACFACHAKYIVRPKDSLYNHKTKDEDFKPPS